MTCQKCGSEKFSVLHVFRNKKWESTRKQWVFSAEIDTREIVCVECNQVYITETTIKFASIYDDKLCKIKFVNPREL